MADHFNVHQLKRFAGTVADIMGLELPEQYAKGIGWLDRLMLSRLGGTADRALLYHADAVGMYIWQKYNNIFAPVYAHTSAAVPFISTVSSVTPVAHASMYTGLDPVQHGILTYIRPQLTCDTLFDELIRAGKKPLIICMTDSTFMHIFAGRDMPIIEVANASEVRKVALDAIEKDIYDVISIHTFEYDNAAHAYGPESKEGLNAISIEAEVFAELCSTIEKNWAGKHRTLISYSPDHGQHYTEGGNGAHGSELLEDMNILHFFGTAN